MTDLSSGPRQRILQATYACVARWGLSKTTLEDAAKEAGLSRATVYRYFPGGREELVNAVVSWQYGQFFARLYEEVQGSSSLEEVLERGLPFARQAVLDHEVLQKVLQTEPDVLLPKLTVEADRTVDLVAAFLEPYVARHGLADGVDLHEAAQFLSRMLLSYMTSPGHWDLADPDQVATLVRAELLAGVVRPVEVVDNETK